MTGICRGGLAAGVVLFSLAVGACRSDSATGVSDSATGVPDTGYDNVAGLAALSGNLRVITATGDLTEALAEFRARLGGPVNRSVGEQVSGRREINWDAVSGANLNVNTFPGDFFNRVVPRGQVYTTDGTGFRVSDNGLGDLNPLYAGQFNAFSPPSIFIPVGRQSLTVNFRVAGEDTPARVSGFGVVFSDVDVAGSTTVSFLDTKGRLLQKISVPVRSDAAGFSFAGATFNDAIVARVRITAGQAAITGRNLDVTDRGESDLVAMDDFISGEPHAIR